MPKSTLFQKIEFLSFLVVFPAGILQAPFYDKRAPKAINYGAIGMIVAHEILHGFDTTGKKNVLFEFELKVVNIAVWTIFEALV